MFLEISDKEGNGSRGLSPLLCHGQIHAVGLGPACQAQTPNTVCLAVRGEKGQCQSLNSAPLSGFKQEGKSRQGQSAVPAVPLPAQCLALCSRAVLPTSASSGLQASFSRCQLFPLP